MSAIVAGLLLVPVLSSNAQELAVSARAATSYNTSNEALSESKFVFNNFPHLGAALLFPVSRVGATRWEVGLSYATYSAHNVASNPLKIAYFQRYKVSIKNNRTSAFFLLVNSTQFEGLSL